MNIPLWRRFTIAFVALAAAAVVFHGQLASALITRGDDALRAGDRTSGLRYYQRALMLDPSCATAADRLAFALALRRRSGDAQAAVGVATTALHYAPRDAALLVDRAFGEQQLGHWAAAQTDFARAGVIARDARYDHLAGRVALVRGRRLEARRYFELALIHDARFEPARAALGGLK